MEREEAPLLLRFQQDIGEAFQMFQEQEEAERTDGTLSFSERQYPGCRAR